MKNQLNKNSMMECEIHGEKSPVFICNHLQYGVGIGFYEPKIAPNEEIPFKNAWCSACEAIATEQGGWNEISEKYAQVMPICEGYFEKIRQRNA